MSCLEIRPSTRPLKILFSTIAALSASASSARLFFAASERKLNRYLLFFCSSYAAASSALNTLPSTAFANRLFRIGFGRDAGSFSALSIVISFVFASSSAEISSLRYTADSLQRSALRHWSEPLLQQHQMLRKLQPERQFFHRHGVRSDTVRPQPSQIF